MTSVKYLRRFPSLFVRHSAKINSLIYSSPALQRNPKDFGIISCILTSSRMMASDSAKPKFTNRLTKEKSPYLLQHQHNPVDWYPWGEEAFEKARKEQKPIFLSVGYSTCHWCHVMERESFENEDIGKILNENFVPIKVDREERPDVDRVYMTYIQAMMGGGGWPMSIWMTPDLKPFVGGTYFPPKDMQGRPGFATILNHIARQWESNKEKFSQQSTIIMNAIQEHVNDLGLNAKDMPKKEVVDKLYKGLSTSFDEELGGFGGAPKFPQPANFNFLLKYYMQKKSDDEGKRALHMCLKSLECMEKGGIHDHVGQISKDEKYADTLRDILLYVMRDLSHKHGGFYSAEDADSLPSFEDKDKKEGAFCVWEEEELKHLLTDTVSTKSGSTIPLSTLFIKYYGVEPEGNVKLHQDPHKELRKKNVLIIRESLQATAESLDVEEEEAKEQLSKAREILYEERKKRPPPHLDDKMVTSWNGLMISGFARAGQVLGEDVYTKRAVKAADFIRNNLYDKDTKELLRSCYRENKDEVSQIANPIGGFSCDYIYFIRGLLDLYDATLDQQWLQWAVELQDKADELFWDKEKGGYFAVAEGDPSILIRMKDEQDGAEPSPSSTSAGNLLRLASLVDCKEYRERAERIFTVYESRLAQIPIALPELVGNLIVYNTGMNQ
ncbi:hypothetical protein QZH41_018106, partial [Actinostola sp. cb2023]